MSAGSTFSCGGVTRTTTPFNYSSKEGLCMVCRPRLPTLGRRALIQVRQLSPAINLPTPLQVCHGLTFGSIADFPISTSHTTFQCVFLGFYFTLHHSMRFSFNYPLSAVSPIFT